MAVPWKLANDAGDPAHSVLVLLVVAASGNTLLSLGQKTVRRKSARGFRPIELGVAALLATFTLAGNHLAAVAVQDMSPSMMNLLLRADLFFTAIAAWAVLGERVDRRFFLGGGIAMLGLAVLQGLFGGSGGATGLAATGTAIASAVCFSGLAVTTRAFIRRIDPVAVNSVRLWIAVGLWFVFNDASAIATIPEDQMLYAAMAAISGPFLGRLTLMISALYIEAHLSSLATLAAPVLTLIPAYLILSDWPLEHQLLGGAIMLAGIAIPLWPRSSEARAR
jgi:drug/metabolite transporter (DMT)-like permease